MTSVKVKPWSKPHDLQNIEGAMTVTRYINGAENANRFRRFIALRAMSESYLLITQTGRWTHRNDAGMWDNGTYKFQKVASTAQQLRCDRGNGTTAFLNEETNRKLGKYQISSAGNSMGASDIRLALNRAGILEQMTMQAQPVQARPILHGEATPVNIAGGELEQRIATLLQSTEAEGADPFALFAPLAELRTAVQGEVERVERMQNMLIQANDILMARI